LPCHAHSLADALDDTLKGIGMPYEMRKIDMLRPLLPPPDIDPEDLIREIEDDPLSRFAWSIVPKTALGMRRISKMLRQQNQITAFGGEQPPARR
jgi:hypothetical protein